MTTLEKLTKIRNELARMHASARNVPAGELSEIGRMLDSIAETAATIRGSLDYGSDTRRAQAFVKRVRKALGYTYP
jgi:hypothetical protein